jgi:metal-sulfur cluster biosynthetic enzyme
VRVEFTPTFLGCPALEVMRSQMADKIASSAPSPTSR